MKTALRDIGDGVDRYQGLRFAEAEESAVLDQQKANPLFPVIDEEVSHLADAVAVLVFHLAAADIVC